MKVLIVGLGSIALKHIDALQSFVPEVEIFAWRQIRRGAAPEGVVEVERIEGLNVDFAIISNPTSMHLDTIIQLLPLRCPLFIEKPVADGLSQREHVLNQVAEAGLLTYVGCNLRFLPTLQFLKSELPKAGKVNEVSVYCGSYLPDWRPHLDYKTSYSARRELGGGVHLDLIHELDYCYWIMGMPHAVTRHLANKSHLDIDASDAAYYHLHYDTFSTNVALNYFRRTPKRTIELVLEENTWLVDLLAGTITDQSGSMIFESKFDIRQTYVDQMVHFLNCIQTQTPTINSLDDGFKVLQMCLAEL